MRLMQRIENKGFFILALFVLCVFSTHSFAQQPTSPPIPPTAGQQIYQNYRDGRLSIGQAATQLSQIGGPALTVTQATDILQNLDANNIAADIGGNLLTSLEQQLIPPDIAETLSTISQLGQINSLTDLENLFQNPQLQAQLDALTGLTGTIDQVQQQIQGVMSQITQIAATPQLILNNAVTSLTNAIVNALPASIQNFFGGAGIMATSLATTLGSSLGILPAAAPGPGGSCGGQACSQCRDCPNLITQNHYTIRTHVTNQFNDHRNWFVNNFFLEYIAPYLARMTSQLSATGMQQVQVIGAFFDAKHQLETQRLFQTMTAQAHKDYHPSEGLCAIGTNVRSLSASERRADLTHQSIARRMMDRQLLSADSLSLEGSRSDRESGWNWIMRNSCNPQGYGGGLQFGCQNTSSDRSRVNVPLSYSTAVEEKLTLDIDFSTANTTAMSDDEETIFMLGSYLFANEVLPSIDADIMVLPNGQLTDAAYEILRARSIAAKRSPAQNSFAAIVGMRAHGDSEVAPFVRALFAAAGIAPTDIEEVLGENPSYFAQMEALTKTLFQNPSFYANLYDKPANVERMLVAMQAIEVMQDRDIFDSLLRSEATLATLIEVLLQDEHRLVSKDLLAVNMDSQ